MVLAQEAKEAAATRRKEQTDRCSFTAKRIKDKNQEQPRESSQQEKRRSGGSQGRTRSRGGSARATRRANQPRERRWVTLWLNSVAGQVELVGLTVARGPQPHSIVIAQYGDTLRKCCEELI